MRDWVVRNGFTIPTAGVIGFFALEQVSVSWAVGPAVTDIFGAPFYFILMPIIGAILDVPAIHFVNKLLSKQSVGFIEKDLILTLPDKNGWIHKTQIEQLPVEEHVKVNLCTSFQAGAVRGAVFLPASFGLIALAGYLLIYVRLMLHI